MTISGKKKNNGRRLDERHLDNEQTSQDSGQLAGLNETLDSSALSEDHLSRTSLLIDSQSLSRVAQGSLSRSQGLAVSR